MLCKIADLLVEIPEAGGMAPRCREYLVSTGIPDITISEDAYVLPHGSSMSHEMLCYMESGAIFYSRLLRFGGLLLHASAIEWQGRAYLFSGPSGVGKSTHTRMWQATFGQAAQVFNDDKPALRLMDGIWYAYGTPWCGKDGINQNKKVPLGGICFLVQGRENRIRRLEKAEALSKFMWQSIHKYDKVDNLDRMLGLADKLVRQIPAWELVNVPDASAAWLSQQTLCAGAVSAGL